MKNAWKASGRNRNCSKAHWSMMKALGICVHIKLENTCIERNPGGREILGMKVWQIEIVVKCIGVSRSGVDGWQLVEVAASPWHPTPPTAPTHSLGFYSPPTGFVGNVICISSTGFLHFSSRPWEVVNNDVLNFDGTPPLNGNNSKDGPQMR